MYNIPEIHALNHLTRTNYFEFRNKNFHLRIFHTKVILKVFVRILFYHRKCKKGANRNFLKRLSLHHSYNKKIISWSEKITKRK